MNIEKIIDEARAQGFSSISLTILKRAARTPQNPYNYFGGNPSRKSAYGNFERLLQAGFLEMVDPPEDRGGHHWYRTVLK